MTNPKRFFMVEVAGCSTCPIANLNARCCMKNPAIDHESYVAAYRIYQENKDAITPSCPLYGQSQEEKKC